MAGKRILNLNPFTGANLEGYKIEIDKEGLQESESWPLTGLVANILASVNGQNALITPNVIVFRNPVNTNAPAIDIVVASTDGTPLKWMVAGVLYQTASPVNLVLDAKDATNPRYDLVYLGVQTLQNPQGVYVRKGTATETPVKPQINQNEVELSFVYIPAQSQGEAEPEPPETFKLEIQQVTNPVYKITATDIERGYVDVSLQHAIAKDFHVFAWLNSVPLTIKSRNGQNLQNGEGSVSYNEGEATVRISFTDAHDFGTPAYKTEIGWAIMVKYTRTDKAVVLPPVSNVTVQSVTGVVTYNDLKFDIVLANTGIPENINATLRLTNSGGTVIDTYTSSLVNVGNGYTFSSITWQNLTPDTYTLTVTLANGSTGNDSETLTAYQAQFRAVDITATRTSSTEIQVIQTIKNIGNIQGDFVLLFELYDFIPSLIESSGFITKTIPAGGTAYYVYTFTGVINVEYNAYSKCDGDVYTYNSGDNYYYES